MGPLQGHPACTGRQDGNGSVREPGGEELEKKLRRMRLCYMSGDERRAYYAQLRQDSARGGIATSHATDERGCPASPVLEAAAAVRRVTLNPSPQFRAQKYAGYLPVDEMGVCVRVLVGGRGGARRT
jgi:hypothetical protein